MSAVYHPSSFVTHLASAPPDILYHYTNQSGLLGIIENSKIWATKIRYMNDATEFELAFETVDNHLTTKEIGMDDIIAPRDTLPKKKQMATTLWKLTDNIRDVNVCVACFCTK